MSDSSSAKVRAQFRITPEQALLVIPILIGIAISLVVALGGLYPLLPMLQKQEQRLKLYQEQRDDLPFLRRRLIASDDQYLKLQNQQLKLVSLVSSADKLDTIFTAINRLALVNDLDIVSVEPENKSLYMKDTESKKSPKSKKTVTKASDVILALKESKLFNLRVINSRCLAHIIPCTSFLLSWSRCRRLCWCQISSFRLLRTLIPNLQSPLSLLRVIWH